MPEEWRFYEPQVRVGDARDPDPIRPKSLENREAHRVIGSVAFFKNKKVALALAGDFFNG